MDRWAVLLDQMEAQRTAWADLAPGKRVQFRRPLEDDMPRLRSMPVVDLACEFVCGWEGITEADLLGAAMGSDAPAPFHVKLWSRFLRDNLAHVEAVAAAIVRSVTDHVAARDAAAKN